MPIRYSSPKAYQIILSTAHPAKFSEAVTKALEQNVDFNFEQDVLPKEFRGLLDKERVVVVERPELALVKEVIEWHAKVVVDLGDLNAAGEFVNFHG